LCHAVPNKYFLTGQVSTSVVNGHKIANMNLGKYIQKLLMEHETVIVPGLGAFVSKYKSAEPDGESGKMLPPSKGISFEPKVQNNDGVLAGQIAEQEQVSHFEALKKIKEECEDIIFRLDKGERVTLENTGVLFYNQNREIQFVPSGEENLLVDAFGLEAISLPDKSGIVQKEQTEIRNEPETKENTGEGREEETTTDDVKVAPEPDEADPLSVYEPFFRDPYVPYRRKKRGRWYWFLLLIPLVAAGVFFYLQKEEKEQRHPEVDITIEPAPPEVQRPETQDSTEQISGGGVPGLVQNEQNSGELTVKPAGTVPDDSALAQMNNPVQATESTYDSFLLVKPDTSKFYLVAGSFKALENAEKYLQFLNSEGY
jgi:nucleoid DNA-binding protein